MFTPQTEGSIPIGRGMTQQMLGHGPAHTLRPGNAVLAAEGVQGFDLLQWECDNRSHRVIIPRHQITTVR